MSRRRRLQFPDAIYHVMSRGNRKSAIVADDVDRHGFMFTLAETAIRYGVRVYAACLMDNHYHALLDTPRGNLSDAIGQLNSTYSRTSNQRHNRSGHTFEARFHSVVVQRERYLRRVARYIVANPVKAGLCANAAQWRWSTYRATAGLEPAPDWLYLDWIDWAFHENCRASAQDRYRQYVDRPAATTFTVDLKARILGSKEFQERANQLVELDEVDGPLPGIPPCPPSAALETVFAPLAAGTHRRDACIHTAHVTHGYRLSEIAEFLRLKSNTVRQAFRRHTRRPPRPTGLSPGAAAHKGTGARPYAAQRPT